MVPRSTYATSHRRLIVLDALFLVGLAAFTAFLALVTTPHTGWRLPLPTLAVFIWGWVGWLIKKSTTRSVYVQPPGVPEGRTFQEALGSEFSLITSVCAVPIVFLPDSHLSNLALVAASISLILASLAFWHWRVRRHLSLIPPDAAALS